MTARRTAEMQALLHRWRDAVPDDRLAHLAKDATRALVRALEYERSPLSWNAISASSYRAVTTSLELGMHRTVGWERQSANLLALYCNTPCDRLVCIRNTLIRCFEPDDLLVVHLA